MELEIKFVDFNGTGIKIFGVYESKEPGII